MKSTLVFVITLGLSTFFFNSGKNSNMDSSNSYEKLWKDVEDFKQNGRSSSARDVLFVIYNKASDENNLNNLGKSVYYLNEVFTELEEEGQTKFYLWLNEEISKAKQPIKSLLHTLAGETLYAIYQQNSYQLSTVTNTDTDFGMDITKWTKENFIEKIRAHFYSSIEDPSSLQIKNNALDSILQKNELFMSLYEPTVYDVLMFRVFDYISKKNLEPFVPFESFKMTSLDYLGQLSDFLSLKINDQDKKSVKYQHVKLYQDYLKSLVEKNKSQPIISKIDLERLKYVYQNFEGIDKDQEYRNTLLELKKVYKDEVSQQVIVTELAKMLQVQGQAYDHKNNETLHLKNNFKEALLLLEQYKKENKPSFLLQEFKDLYNTLTSSHLNFVTEEVYLPNKDVLFKLDYSNIDHIEIYLSELKGEDALSQRQMYNDEFTQWKVKSNKVLELTLPQEDDLRLHSLEYYLDSKPSGVYFVVVAAMDKWGNEKHTTSIFAVSNLAMLSFNEDNQTDLKRVLVNRTNGTPVSDAQLEIYSSEYKINKEVFKLEKKIKTDKEGFIQLDNLVNKNLFIKAVLGNDVMYAPLGYYWRNNRQQPRVQEYAHIFTDRAIYRPGQTVHYKVVYYHRSTDNTTYPELVNNTSIDVILRDANFKEVVRTSKKTDHLGAVNGHFVLPEGGLAGNFTILVNNNLGQYNFSVEEYKRPKFEVKIETPKEIVTLGKEVQLKASAKYYSGVPAEGAQFNYRVVRKHHFPYWFRWYFPVDRQEAMIKSGSGIVDATGAMDIAFDAIPEQSLENIKRQFYNYFVEVDVIDVNGETRSAQISIPVSSVPLYFETVAESQLLSKNTKNQTLKILSKNVSGIPVDADYTLSVDRLTVPKGDWIKRYWEETDTHIMNESDFRKKFPNYPFKGELDSENMKIQDNVFSKRYNNTKENNLKYADIGITKKGYYRITVKSLHPSGNVAEVVTYVEVLDDKKPISLLNTQPYFLPEINEVKPGDIYQNILVFNKAINGFLFTSRMNKPTESKKLHFKEIHKIEQKIEESDRGGLQYHFTGISNNRFFSINDFVSIPWSNKALIIEVEDFKEVVEPGSKQRYLLTVKDDKGAPVNGRLLASAYDASLDQFRDHQWKMSFSPRLNKPLRIEAVGFQARYGVNKSNWSGVDTDKGLKTAVLDYPRFKYNIYTDYYYRHSTRGMLKSAYPEGMPVPNMAPSIESEGLVMDAVESSNALTPPVDEFIEESGNNNAVSLRENLNETVFFYPEIEVKDGKAVIEYVMNEALTEWKLQIIGYDSEMRIGSLTKSIQTSKDLMVFPNLPRFLRQGDSLVLETRVNNLSKENLKTKVSLLLSDPLIGEDVNTMFSNNTFEKEVEIKAESNSIVQWTVKVPEYYAGALEVIVQSVSANSSDGERNVLPVISDKVFLTETMPMHLKSGENKTFEFNRFMEKYQMNPDFVSQKFVLEYTANPVWLAVQSLPYLDDNNFNSSMSFFNRYLANSLSKYVVDNNPQIKKVFEQWKISNSDELQSALTKNDELKNILLEETPWVLDAESEEQQKKNIALFFDQNQINLQISSALAGLKNLQRNDGGFAWFNEPRSNWYISMNILNGFTRLGHLGVVNLNNPELRTMLNSLVKYSDEMLAHEYSQLEKNVKAKKAKWEDDHLSHLIINHLFVKAYFTQLKGEKINSNAYQYYFDQAEKFWTKRSLYDQINIALTGHYFKGKLNSKIVLSLKERALINDELGIYWVKMSGLYWNENALSIQSKAIDLFNIAGEKETVDGAKTWLLKNKQTVKWNNSATTAEAILALLTGDGKQNIETKIPNIKVGGTTLIFNTPEAGTGYVKKSWTGTEIEKDLGVLEITNNQNTVAWGAAYWQYFDKIENVTANQDGPLKVNRRVYKKEKSDTGTKLLELKNGMLQKGDELVIRIEIEVDRPMEFVHIKDQRASAVEPLDVISSYKFSGGLGYYQVTKDISTNFFIDWLPRGSYVLEYSARVFQNGSFSTGMTQIESMYAPEFKSHSAGNHYEMK